MANTDFWSSPDEKAKALRWLLGIGGVWIILTLMVDLGETSDLAVALAIVIMGSVLLQYGPDVFKSLGINTTSVTSAKGGTNTITSSPYTAFGWEKSISGAKIFEA